MEMEQTKIKRSASQIIGRILLWAGAAIVAVGVGYEAYNLPWTSYLQKWGWMETPVTLPDPPALDADWADMDTLEVIAHPEMPAQEKRFLVRGDVTLELLGYLKIPKLGLSENVVEGAGNELYYAIGHIEGTALPGRTGNSVLGAHRNYIPMHPFRNLDQIEIGDKVYFEDQVNRYTYEVYEIFDVEPSQVEVLEPIEGEACVMTLITCTPATTMNKRMIVRTRLTGTEAVNAVAQG